MTNPLPDSSSPSLSHLLAFFCLNYRANQTSPSFPPLLREKKNQQFVIFHFPLTLQLFTNMEEKSGILLNGSAGVKKSKQ